MCDLADKFVLFLFCMSLFPFDAVRAEQVCACLAAVIVSALGFSFPDPRFRRPVLVFYGLLQLFLPACCLFLPLAVFEFFPQPAVLPGNVRSLPGCSSGTVPEKPRRAELSWLPDWLSLSVPFGCFLFCGLYRRDLGAAHPFLPHWFRFWMILSCCLLAALLRRREDLCLGLRRRLQETQDEDTEIQLLLRERSQSLLEKQNSEIFSATLRERSRIAREIHDNVGHMLTRSILMVGALKTVCREPELTAPLEQLADTLGEAMDSIRRSVHDLHDSSVDLEEALRSMIRDFTFCPVSLQYDMPPGLPGEVRYSLISIAREALVNISKHSSATRAEITVIAHPAFFQFIIRDNGNTGSRAQQTDSPGIGLINIRNRVSALRGNIQIRTEQGFCIYITIPRS